MTDFDMHEMKSSGLLGRDSVKGAARSEQSRLKRRISAVQFAMWELHLYLDSHPHCTEAAKKLQEHRALWKKLHAEYEDKYGPINETARETSRWAWISDPWPWEAEANE